MANTIRPYTGDGTTVLYPIDFDLGYIRKSHIYVYLEGNDFTVQLDYTYISNVQIQLVTPVAMGTVFNIRRVVPRDSLVNDYEDGAALHEGNLDNSFVQSLMLLQEIEDGYIKVRGPITYSLDIDMQGNRILNLPLPLSDEEPMRRGDIATDTTGASILYVDESIGISEDTLNSYNDVQDGRLDDVDTELGEIQQEKEDVGVASSLILSHDGDPLAHPSMLAAIDNLTANQQSGVIVFLTLALLNAHVPTVPEETASFKVTNDDVSSVNNGYYSWDGVNYVQDASLVSGVVDENNTTDAVSGKAVVDYTAPLFGEAFTGASEYWETLSTVVLPDVMLIDSDDRILFRGFDISDTPDTVDYEEYETLATETGDWLVLDLDDRILHSNVSEGGGGDGIEEAPIDGTPYSRQDAGWVASPGGGGTNSEVIDARGVQASLDDRLSITLDPYGMQKQSVYGDWYLRELKQRTRSDKSGTSKQLRLMMIGDSWTHLSVRYSKQLGIDLNDYMGAGGHAGFTGFSWGYGTLPSPTGQNTNYNPDETTVTYQGAWTANYTTASSPDICSAQSSTVGASIDLITTTYGKVGTLFASNNGAVIRYQSNGGSWTNLTLDGTDEFYPLTLPDQVSVTIRFEVVSGTAILYGVELHNLSGGAIISKVGATGSTLANWATMSNNAQWRNNVQELAPNTVTILHGTNDQGNFTKAQFKANGKTLIDNIRAVLPLVDIMLIAPCENGRGFTPAMSEYQEAFSELAYENRCCYLNLQAVFGETYSEYGDMSTRKWFEADTIHPNTDGGYTMVDAIFKTFTR